MVPVEMGRVKNFMSMYAVSALLTLLGLLLTIPFHPIPLEPCVGLPREFLTDINPKSYDSHGVTAWGVAVVQAGIGEKAGLKNSAFCVAVVTSDDHLKLYPWNVTTAPIITWDRDKLRRSGSIGDMVFMEAGRRCRFGPGLLWMFAESSVSVSLREGLHTFLFKGGNNMAGHFRRASEVSIASSRSSDASFDQSSSRTPESASGSLSHVVHRQQSTTRVNSMASDLGVEADSITAQGIQTNPSGHHKHRSPPTEQHSQLSTVNDASTSDLSDYETMAPIKSLLTPPRNGLPTLPYHTEDEQHFSQSQATLINGMKAYDEVPPRSAYDNIRLRATPVNYENTAIQFKPVSSNN